jgi:hypothetical protein
VKLFKLAAILNHFPVGEGGLHGGGGHFGFGGQAERINIREIIGRLSNL